MGVPAHFSHGMVLLDGTPPTRGYQLTFLYVGVFGVPAHFLIYGKDTGFLFVIGCSK